MAENNSMNAELGKIAPQAEKVAERWLRMQGIQKTEEQKLTSASGKLLGKVTEALKSKAGATLAENPTQVVNEAYDLLVEKDDLRNDVVAKQREAMEPGTTNPLTIDQKRERIKQGKVSSILSSASSKEPAQEVVGRSQNRLKQIDERIDQIFSVPGTYDKFKEDLSRQVRVRHQGREVESLDEFIDGADITAVKLTREAQVRGRALTSVETQIVQDNQALREEAIQRKQELLKDPDVFDRVRILELQEYRRQMAEDHFAETPSRKVYLKKIETYWAEAKKVLLTGETGTGKTETIKHASQTLFGVAPESVTGHQDMSIYELLGKTGFKVQEGDVFRPAPLIRAMTGREGRGQPFLFDEIDRAPNQSVMGIKTILNARPGERGIRVQTDSAGSFNVGPDYAVAATANIKSEKYVTATELDPAIVRVFDAPMDVDYMPAPEVYDLALAALMDKRGGVPLSETDAKTYLKSLCDAASWIQDAYQGRRVTTDPSTGSFLEARGQAATDKAATLRKALLDPGRTLDMLKGWQASRVKGESFEAYLNQRVIEFINNRAYPEEDRYYLTEIFALKGFLKGRKASELMVSGLTQETLDRWSGATGQRHETKKSKLDYLQANRVARLDPYRRFKRPASAEAQELLQEEVVEAEASTENLGGGMIERAKVVLGKDFLGREAIKIVEGKLKAIGINVEFDVDKAPPFPYKEADLQIAKQNGEMLVLRPDTMIRGGREVPITLLDLQEVFKKDPLGKSGSPFYHSSSGDWYKDEKFVKSTGEIKLQWSLVKKELLDGSTNQTWNDQETLLKQYEGGLRRKGAAAVSVRRRTATEAAWDTMLYYASTGERLLGNVYDWGQTKSSGGNLVCVGRFDSSAGLGVNYYLPGRSASSLGVCPSR